MPKSPTVKLEGPGMLTSLRLKNFKCYRDSGEIPLAPLTVLIGRNNVGKSAILQPLLMLKQTLMDSSWTSRLVTAGTMVQAGGFQQMYHGKFDSDAQAIQFIVGREPKESLVEAPEEVNFREATKVGLSFQFNEAESRIEVARLAFSDDQGEVSHFCERGGEVEWSAAGVAAKDKKLLTPRFRNFLIDCHLDKKGIGKRKDPKALVDSYMSLELQSHAWMRIFAEVYHIGPVRSKVPWHTVTSARYPSDSGASGENVMRLLSQKSRANRKSLLQETNEWLQEHESAVQNLKVENVDRLGHVRSLLADDPCGHDQINVAGMGEGVSQMLPIIAQVLRVRKWDTFVIEQPEIHLHPLAQGDLGDLFVDAAKDGTQQLLVETHSEHLLLRIRRRIAEGAISPEKVAVLFVDKDKMKKQSTVRRLDLNKRGHFDDWPAGFFDEAYQEAMKLAMAQPIKE